MAFILKMNPDLMGSPGFQVTFYKRYITHRFYDLVMRNGMFSLLSVGINRHYLPVFGTPSDITYNRTLRFFHFAPDHGYVGAFDTVVIELVCEMIQGKSSFGYHEEAGGILID